MKRGDLIKVALQGDYGKPRPAVIIQSDRLNATHGSFLVCLMTSTLVDLPLFRVRVAPSATNGLVHMSDVMTDKIYTVKRQKVGSPFGRLDTATIVELDAKLAIVAGLND